MLKTIKGTYSEDQHGEFISTWNEYLTTLSGRKPARLNIVTLDEAGSAEVHLTYDDSLQEDVTMAADFTITHPPMTYGEQA